MQWYKGSLMRQLAAISLLVMSTLSYAETAYVVEGIHANLRSGKINEYRVINVLPPGAAVEIQHLEQDYAQVITGDGMQGWLLTKLLRTAQGKMLEAGSTLDKTKSQLNEAQEEVSRLEAELKMEQERSSKREELLWWLGGGILLLGIIIGMVIREAQYRKKLNGLRV
jgi:uncharacterized protein YgiM (DUF1202 family)